MLKIKMKQFKEGGHIGHLYIFIKFLKVYINGILIGYK